MGTQCMPSSLRPRDLNHKHAGFNRDAQIGGRFQEPEWVRMRSSSKMLFRKKMTVSIRLGQCLFRID